MYFKRKVYDKLLEWKKIYSEKYAVLLEGARRVGKSTIAETFAKNEYRSYIIGVINLLISYQLLKLVLLFIDDIWKYEDCTIPAILFIVLLDFIGILLANVITRHKL